MESAGSTGRRGGTAAPNRATKFTLVPDRSPTDYSDRLGATVQIEQNRYFTLFRYKEERAFKGVYWRLETK